MLFAFVNYSEHLIVYFICYRVHLPLIKQTPIEYIVRKDIHLENIFHFLFDKLGEFRQQFVGVLQPLTFFDVAFIILDIAIPVSCDAPQVPVFLFSNDVQYSAIKANFHKSPVQKGRASQSSLKIVSRFFGS